MHYSEEQDDGFSPVPERPYMWKVHIFFICNSLISPITTFQLKVVGHTITHPPPEHQAQQLISCKQID